MAKNIQFRSDISFLRAVSVLAVLLFHYKQYLFKGGFIGVDIFFVISGYLMTRIILSGWKKNTFNILDFYRKRVVRIFPALITTILFIGIAVYILVPTQIINYSKSAFSSSLFFSNIYYYLNTGYFDPSSQFNFLLHTWSLSVEWQFYMLYPILLIPLKKLYINNKRWFVVLFLFLILLSFGSMILHNIKNSGYSFYIFYPRAWEMMAGGLAFIYEEKAKNINRNIKNTLVFISILLIGICINRIDETIFWPSYLTLIPVVSTAILIWCNVDWGIFKLKITRFLGDISYSLYLWHWPLYVLSLFYGLNLGLRNKLFFIILSFIFAIISYYTIEKRDYNKRAKPILITSLFVFICFFLVTRIDTIKILPSEVAELTNHVSNYKFSTEAEEQYSFGTNHLNHDGIFDKKMAYNWKIDSRRKNIILLGDSHAGMFGKTLREYYAKKGINLIQITADATYPMENSETIYKGPKDLFNYFFKEYFPNNYKYIDKVIINSNYAGYDKNDIIKKINYTENYFSKYKKEAIYIGQNKMYQIDFPTTYYFSKKHNIQYKGNIDRHNYVREINEVVKNHLKLKYIDILDINLQPVSRKCTPIMYDTSHLTQYGADSYLLYISEKI